eukprot:768362-Hanusia_phi.AAC.3
MNATKPPDAIIRITEVCCSCAIFSSALRRHMKLEVIHTRVRWSPNRRPHVLFESKNRAAAAAAAPPSKFFPHVTYLMHSYSH